MPGALTLMLGRSTAVGPPSWNSGTGFPSPSLQSTAWSGYTVRQVTTSARLPVGSWNRVRFKIRGGTSEAITITNAYIGISTGTGGISFAATPVQVLWSGSAGCVVPINTDLYCDAVTLSIPSGSDLLIALYTAAGNTTADNYEVGGGVSSITSQYKLANDAATQTATGYTPNSNQCHVLGIDVSL